MAKSLKCGPLGSDGLLPAARTPGPLGWNDQSDPSVCSLFGDTRGPLGVLDWADPTLPRLDRRVGGGLSDLCRAADGTALVIVASDPKADEVIAAPITPGQLAQLFTTANGRYLKQVADELNNDLAAYGLDTALRKAHFFAQVRQESGSAMVATEESLNYAPAALKKLFSYYRKHPEEATTDGREVDPKSGKILRRALVETIANKAYASRNGNGNESSGDGWRFRGRGLKQVTGRANYASATRQYRQLYKGGLVDFEKSPDLMCAFPYAVRSAVCFWVANGLPALADNGSGDAQVDAITEIVNKHTPSKIDRRKHFRTAWVAFK